MITCSYIPNVKVHFFVFDQTKPYYVPVDKTDCFCHGSKGNMAFVDLSTIKLKVRRAKFTCFKSVNFATEFFVLLVVPCFFVFSLKFGM